MSLSHNSLLQLICSLSALNGLERLELTNIICREQSDSCHLPVLDLHKHLILEDLTIDNISINDLLLPSQTYSSLEDLDLHNLVFSHGSLVQLCRSLSSLTNIERLELINLACNEHPDSCRLHILDLQKHHSLEVLTIDKIAISRLLLPSKTESQLEQLNLNTLALSHDSLVQLCSSISALSGLDRLQCTNLSCGDHSGSSLLPLVDPLNEELDHEHQPEKPVDYLLALSGLEHLQLTNIPCGEPSASICKFTVLDLHKHDRLRVLKLDTLSVSGLLLPNKEESQLEDLDLKSLALSHYSLEHTCSSISFLCSLERLQLVNLTCCDHTDSCQLPVLELPEAEIDYLDLEEMSVGGLQPSQCSFSTVNLTRVTMPTESWVKFIRDFVDSSIMYKCVGIVLESCNIDSDTRAFISCCPQFCVKTNNDELIDFELIESGNDSSEDTSTTDDANTD